MNIYIDFGNMWDALSAVGTIAAVIVSLVISFMGYFQAKLNIKKEQVNKVSCFRTDELNTASKRTYAQHSKIRNDSQNSIYDIYVIAIPLDNKNKLRDLNSLKYIKINRLGKQGEALSSHDLDSNKFKELEMKLGVILRDGANNIWYKSPDFSITKVSKRKLESFKKNNKQQNM